MLTLIIAFLCVPLIGVLAIELEARFGYRKRMDTYAMEVRMHQHAMAAMR